MCIMCVVMCLYVYACACVRGNACTQYLHSCAFMRVCAPSWRSVTALTHSCRSVTFVQRQPRPPCDSQLSTLGEETSHRRTGSQCTVRCAVGPEAESLCGIQTMDGDTPGCHRRWSCVSSYFPCRLVPLSIGVVFQYIDCRSLRHRPMLRHFVMTHVISYVFAHVNSETRVIIINYLLTITFVSWHPRGCHFRTECVSQWVRLH